MQVKKHLGKILVEKNIITQEDLQEALLAQKGTGLRLGELIVRKGLATEEDIMSALSEHYNIPYQMSIQFDDQKGLFSRIPVHFLKNNKIAPFKWPSRPFSWRWSILSISAPLTT
jgi:type IV pilus assembly protein PilB